MKTDSELLRNYQQSGDLNVLKDLYTPYQAKVLRLCMHYLKNAAVAEDAVVDIFLEIKDKIPKYQIDNFPAWLHTVARNHCLKLLRQNARQISAELRALEQKVEFHQEEHHMDVLLEQLPEAIDALEERQRRCIVLHYLHKKSYKEIEQISGYTAMEVKSGIQHGKRKLKKILGDVAGPV